MKGKQSGFTLIELIVVILLIAILAAVALPKFINMAAQARVSQMQGISAELQNAVSMARSNWIMQGNGALTTVTIDDATVDVSPAGSAAAGWPTAIQSTGGDVLYTKLISSAVPSSLTTTVASPLITYNFTGYDDCTFIYSEATGMINNAGLTVDNCD